MIKKFPTAFSLGYCLAAQATNPDDNGDPPSVVILSGTGPIILSDIKAIEQLKAACEHALKPWSPQ